MIYGGEGPGTTPGIFTLAIPNIVESAALTAMTEAVPDGEGGVAGPVYRPFAEIVPTRAFPPGVQSTVHTTTVLLVPLIVAVNCCVAPGLTVTCVGETDTVIEGGAHNSGS